jgi:hypothetical protein
VFGLTESPPGIPLKATGVDLPAPTLDIRAKGTVRIFSRPRLRTDMRPSFAEPNVLPHQTKSQRDDNEGWITNQRMAEISCSQGSQLPSPSGHSRVVPVAVQDDGLATLSVQGPRATLGTDAMFNAYISII